MAGQEKQATADEEGTWCVVLDPLETETKGQTLTIKGSNRIDISNVVVGEVWICSGQSNMQVVVRSALDALNEIKSANYPLIRRLRVPDAASDIPMRDIRAAWAVCSPQTVPYFTAVGYFFARELNKELGVPIGLINASWGGTRIEPWIPPEGYELIKDIDFAKRILTACRRADPSTDAGKKAYMQALAKLKEWLVHAGAAVAADKYPPLAPRLPNLGPSHQSPTRIYRAMIHPVVPFAIRGAIWYQGESNGREGLSYYNKMKALIGGWRRVWGPGRLPILLGPVGKLHA